MATYNGETVRGILRHVQCETSDGAIVSPSMPIDPSIRIRGLALEDGEAWRLVGASGDGTADVEIVAEPARERTRRGLRQALRRVRVATQASEIAEPLDMQRIVLALVSEVFGGD